MKLTFPTEFRTKRLTLRPPQLSDAQAIFKSYAQDAEVTRFLIWQPHRFVTDTRQFLKWCIDQRNQQKNFAYVLCLRSKCQVIGMADLRPGDTQMEIGYVLARNQWGRGLMVEAVKALTAAALKNRNIHRVFATCSVENTGSARVLEKSGFTREGRLRKYAVNPNISPIPGDAYLYAKVKFR